MKSVINPLKISNLESRKIYSCKQTSLDLSSNTGLCETARRGCPTGVLKAQTFRIWSVQCFSSASLPGTPLLSRPHVPKAIAIEGNPFRSHTRFRFKGRRSPHALRHTDMLSAALQPNAVQWHCKVWERTTIAGEGLSVGRSLQRQFSCDIWAKAFGWSSWSTSKELVSVQIIDLKTLFFHRIRGHRCRQGRNHSLGTQRGAVGFLQWAPLPKSC